ncbi:MAG: Ig-like domain-containing protein [Nannocystaceae bacterium]|nr:Ig-like domain-containing protein [Myxococcales bacterium]
MTALAARGCTQPSDTELFATVEETIEIVETRPAQGATGVARSSPVELCLSRTIDPGAIDRTHVAIFSGAVWFDSTLEIQLFATHPDPSDPDDRPWCPGSVISVRPRGAFEGGIQYRVRVQPSAIGWAGEPLDTETAGWVAPDSEDELPLFWLEFTTAEELEDPSPEIPGPTLEELFAPGAIFDPEATTCGCHREEGSLARALLDLSTPSRAYRDLVLEDRVGSTGYPMVAPRVPAESYLIHTLLRDADGHALRGVLGDPMPPGEPASYAHALSLVRWIEAGALR